MKKRPTIVRTRKSYGIFIKPEIIKKLVPEWSMEEAKDCAKYIYGVVVERVETGTDQTYAPADFEIMAYIGVMQGRRLYYKKFGTSNGNVTLYFLHKIIYSYTAEEVKKKQKTKHFDILHTKDITDLTDDRFVDAADESARDDWRVDETIEFVIKHYPELSRYVRAFFVLEGNRAALKIIFGSHYAALNRGLTKAAKAFAAERRAKMCVSDEEDDY